MASAFSTQPTKDDVEGFVELLCGRGWVHAHVLVAELNINKRHLRALAEASKGRVISGNQGYRVTSEAASLEVDTCCDRLGSQGRRMIDRCSNIRAIWYSAQPSKSNPF